MAEKWDKAKAAFDFLKAHEGREVSESDIAKATSWKPATVTTYIVKKWAGLLLPVEKGRYRVSGTPTLDWQEFKALHTQTVRPPLAPAPSVYDYEVALSFAGEDRPFVSTVAEILRAYGIDVFYDLHEQHTLWGKDLYVHLDDVYRVRSRYCVIFASQYYAKKLWTSHERRSAQARAFTERAEYILPVRLDDVEIPALPTTIAYLDGRVFSATDIANAIADKLGRKHEVDELIEEMRDNLAGYTITQVGTNLRFENPPEDYTNDFSIAMLLEARRASQLWVFLRSSIFVQ